MQRRFRSCLELFSLCLMFAAPPNGAAASTVLLRDDFSGSSLNTGLWNVGTWRLGRTQLGNQPIVSGGIARLTFDTFNFKGSEIFTKARFARGAGLEIESRIKLNNAPSGLVAALFTYFYNSSTATSDEIDIEILTRQVNSTANGDPTLLATWNDWSEQFPTSQDGVHNWSISRFNYGLDVNSWHTYVIRWLRDRTEWLIDGIIVESSSRALPDEDMPVRLNFWAPDRAWADAYDGKLSPANKAAQNKRYFLDVDYVEIRQLPD